MAGGPLDAADGALCAKAASVIVPYDMESHQPRRLRPIERTVLDVYFEPEDAAG